METSETRLQAFGVSCHLIVSSAGGDGEALLQSAHEEILRLERKFSAFDPDSLISQINRDAGGLAATPIDAETRGLFSYVTALWRESSHLFDPSVRLVYDCYDSDGKVLASIQQLNDITRLVGWSKLEISDEGARLSSEGMLIDLNSCVRPYAVDTVLKLLRRNGAESAMIEMGADSGTIGRQADGANWTVGVRFPRGSRTGIARLKLNNRGFAVRGDFERAVTINDELFGRTLSPVDGLPIPGLLSVVVVADNCLTACSAASIARTKSESNGIKWLKQLGFPWMAIDRNLNCHGPLAPEGV